MPTLIRRAVLMLSALSASCPAHADWANHYGAREYALIETIVARDDAVAMAQWAANLTQKALPAVSSRVAAQIRDTNFVAAKAGPQLDPRCVNPAELAFFDRSMNEVHICWNNVYYLETILVGLGARDLIDDRFNRETLWLDYIRGLARAANLNRGLMSGVSSKAFYACSYRYIVFIGKPGAATCSPPNDERPFHAWLAANEFWLNGPLLDEARRTHDEYAALSNEQIALAIENDGRNLSKVVLAYFVFHELRHKVLGHKTTREGAVCRSASNEAAADKFAATMLTKAGLAITPDEINIYLLSWVLFSLSVDEYSSFAEKSDAVWANRLIGGARSAASLLGSRDANDAPPNLKAVLKRQVTGARKVVALPTAC